MAFERIQKQKHTIVGTTVFVSYDRFTTRFKIETEDKVIFSSLTLFPIKKSKIVINNKNFTLKILWLILWKSQLKNNDGSVLVKELLYRRHKRSIGLLIYFILISSIKLGIGLVA